MESAWIEYLRSESGTELIGDDAAVIDGKVFTVDMLTEGVDFILSEVSLELVGRKSLAVNLSDIAAMGAVPESVLIAVSLPRNKQNKSSISKTDELVKIGGDSGDGGDSIDGIVKDDAGLILASKLYAGMKPLLEKYHVKVAGGDTNCWDGGLVIAITAIGSVLPQGVFKRAGVKADDAILVTGELGGSILRHQFLFEPRIFEAIYLNQNHTIHAAIDISDGLAIDLHKIAKESNLGAIISANRIPISNDAITCSKNSGRTPLEHALADGEDFELLLAAPQSEADNLIKTQPLLKKFGTKLHQIGHFKNSQKIEIINQNGTTSLLPKIGYEH
ncbi:MAG: thiamine-phosphate kinase [Planctomycetaceae bacterium]|jgi:thiamine-monophosphate kinase|nr:thiamine-phosphate kinase [Planctomycetaceae bacterium]